MATRDASPSDRARTAHGDVRFWPWGPRAAALTVPAALIVLLILLWALRAATGWPDDDDLGWVLLAILLLSLVPLILLLLEATVRNRGEVRVFGISFSFAAASQEAAAGVRSATLDENLGTDTVEAVGRTSLPVVMRALRRAHDSDVIVVDLRAGQTWWESRLFILVAGATRRGKPEALAFVGDSNGGPGAFLGWAAPSRLLELHLSAEPALAAAYALALAKTRRWEIGTPIVPATAGEGPVSWSRVEMPWKDSKARPPRPETMDLPFNFDQPSDPQFAFELFVNEAIETSDPGSYRRPVTIQRLRALYEPALVTDHIERGSADEEWMELFRRAHRRFFAITSQGRLRALVPRDALLTALVLRLADTPPATGARADEPRR